MICTEETIRRADRLVRKYGTRDADRLAAETGLIVVPCSFHRQKGVYKVIERNRYVFLKEDLDPVMHSIVLLHELGHDMLHRKEAVLAGAFQEFNIFEMKDRRMEFEANVFAAQISLPDEEILRYIYQGCDAAQIAGAMHSDINLVSIKISELNRRGYEFRETERKTDFLR